VTHDVVALTGALLEPFAVEKHDVAAPVTDQAPDLQCLRQQRHRRPPNTQHLRQIFLGQRQLVAAGTIGALQKPAAQARPGRVRRITGSDLLRLCKQHFGIAQDQVADGRAAVSNALEAFGAYGRELASDLRGRSRERPPSTQTAVQPDRAFASDRGGFYGAALPADHQQRDEAGLREVDVGYRIARLKQDGSLLERDLFQVPAEKCESIGGQCRKQAVVPRALGLCVGQNSPPKLAQARVAMSLRDRAADFAAPDRRGRGRLSSRSREPISRSWRGRAR
jgi:hypothetical protein